MLDVASSGVFARDPRPGSRRIAWANRALERAWRDGWSQRPALEPDALVAAAGPGPLGDEAVWRANLEVLCRSLRDEADLTPLGRTMAWAQIVAALRTRRRAHALWSARPEIADIPIVRPVLVLGQMRSGTTRMQRLLACDPRLGWTRHYESWHPVPASWLPGERWLRARATLAAMRAVNPGFAVIHPTRASAPDEEIGLFSPSLFGATFEAQWRAPSFARWCEERDVRPVYAEFARSLRTIAWLRGRGPPKPWIVKVPQLTQDLDAVLDELPDARIVRLERDPVAVVASAASLVRNQMQVQSDAVDPAWIGREWLGKVRLRRDRTAAALAKRPGTPAMTVAFDDMNRDWLGQMRRVYAMLDMELTPPVAARMRRYLARSAGQGLERHRYKVEEFGLSAAEVRAALG